MKRNDGFTLIELLIVISLISILTLIGFPKYAAYKERAYDSGAQSDLRQVASGEEAYFIENNSYLSCVDAGCLEAAPGLPGFKAMSPTVSMSVQSNDSSFIANATTDAGKVFTYDSANGGFH